MTRSILVSATRRLADGVTVRGRLAQGLGGAASHCPQGLRALGDPPCRRRGCSVPGGRVDPSRCARGVTRAVRPGGVTRAEPGTGRATGAVRAVGSEPVRVRDSEGRERICRARPAYAEPGEKSHPGDGGRPGVTARSEKSRRTTDDPAQNLSFC